MFNILVCDDDKEIVDAIDIYLSQEGYHILKAYDGLQAIEIMKKEEVHLILLDIMMPNLDGIRATRKIRETSSVPIIMLSAKSEDVDKILGLNIGADDYITKPYSSKILAARIAVQLRKKQASAPVAQTITLGPLSMDLTAHSVRLNDELLLLTADEFKTLTLLASNPGRVFTRNQIIREVKGDHYSVTARAIDMHIVNLRRKLGDWADHIETIRGVGYRITGG